MAEPTLPDDIAGLTPEIVGRLLAQADVPGARVARVDAEWMAVPGSFAGRIARLTLAHEGDAPGAPRNVVAKLPSAHPQVRQLLGRFGGYAHEIAFYRHVAGLSPLRVPRFFGADLSEDRTAFVLLLEDCSHATPGRQGDGASPAQARAVLTAIASFHAAWWERTTDPALAPFPRLTAAIDVPALYRGAWPEFDKRFGGQVPGRLRERGPRLDATVATLWHALASPPCTLLHGDLRLDNLLFEGGAGDPRPIVVDWQAVTLGRGALDVAYFCAGSLATHPIDVIQSLVRLYHDRLMSAGVRDYAFDACWSDVRVAVAYLWARTVIAGAHLGFAAGPARDLFSLALARWLELAEVCDAQALLRA